MYKACIFDLDGVITDTAHYHFVAWQQLAQSLGIRFTEVDNDQLKGVGRMESLDFILQKSSRDFPLSARQHLAKEKNEIYKQSIEKITPADLLPGIQEAFNWLKENDWKVGLASASRNAMQVIESLGVADVFDYVADAGAIPNGKPAPDIFLDVVTAFGLAPAQCVGVEDAFAGVTAIKAAGIYAIGIGDGSILAQADEVMPTPKTLVQSLMKLAQTD